MVLFIVTGWIETQEQGCVSFLETTPPGLTAEGYTDSIIKSITGCNNKKIRYFLVTYLRTRTPLRVADSRSILSTPVPARPTTFSPLAAAKTSDVTFVSDRTIRPS